MTNMNLRSFMFRLIDNLFKRKTLFLAPIVLFGALGFWLASGQTNFESVGVVQVEAGTLVAELTDVRAEGFDFRTPAQVANDELFGLVLTDSFMLEVVQQTGIEDELRVPGLDDETFLQAVRENISPEVGGDDFITVAATADNPRTAQILAQATIDTFIDRRIEADLQESRIAEEFFADLVEARDADADDARTLLEEWLVDHPGPNAITDRPIDQQVIIEAFRGGIVEAEVRFNEAVDQLEQAELASAQVEADIRQSLLVIEPPQFPIEPQNGPIDTAILAVTFAVIGGLLSAAVLVLTSASDTTLRFPAEVEELVGVELLAVVPKVAQP